MKGMILIMKKICNKLRKNYLYYMVFIILFFLNLAYFLKAYSATNYNKNFLIVIVGSCIIEIVLFILYNLMERKKISIEKKFLFIVSIIGTFYLLALPIGTAPDEYAHFTRSYEISMGHMISDKDSDGKGGRKLPVVIKKVFKFDLHESKYNDMIDLFKIKNTNNKKFLKFGGASLYSPICYIPQILGILVGRLLHLPMIFIVYLTRLFNFICFMTIIYFSIKYIPINKKILCLIVTLPMTMQSAVSCQPDALTNAISFAIISFTLYKIHNKSILTKKENILMCVLAIIMSMCKIVYVPICLVLYLLPQSCFKTKKSKYLRITLLGVIIIAINLIWLFISSSYLAESRPGVDANSQLRFILLNPIRYCNTLFNTWNDFGMIYIFTSLGMYLGALNIGVSQFYLFIYLLFMLYITITEKKEKAFSNYKVKGISLFISIICILLIFTSLYIQYNEVGSNLIIGVQGRYFIPLFMLFPLILQSDKIVSKYKNLDRYCFIFIIMINIYAISSIIGYYI